MTQQHFFPIKVDGKNSVSVSSSLTRVSSIHYVPSAPNDTSPTPTSTPVAGPTNATSTPNLTGPTVSPQGRTDAVTPDSLTGAAVSTEGPTGAAVSTESPITDGGVSTEVSTEGPTHAVVSTDIYVSTEGPTTDVSTQGATDTGKTPGPTDAGVSTVVSTKRRSDNATGGPTSVAVSTEYAADGPTTTISRRDPTSIVTTEGPTDAVESDKDAEDGCKSDKKYFIGIIVLAIILIVLLIIIACLVYQVRKNKDNMKSGILYVTPEKSNDCERIKSEAGQDNATYTTFKKTTNGNNDKLMNESETGF
ncbi:Hypothetical predicted protein [Paramuricea clavata]|uniref:Uncharacterized protein n=1 Tax=Paramuricea clavata TaxID=317549 RepID=A0A7D9EQF3_PARCT|nr:Hypothetical predicted protein [Paramuricea clavata]